MRKTFRKAENSTLLCTNLNFKIILLSLGDIFIYSDIYIYIWEVCICEMCSLELLMKPIFYH